MAFKRKLKKLLRRPGMFMVDAINKRFGGKRSNTRLRLPIITLMVPAHGELKGMNSFLNSVRGRAGGDNGAVEIALLIKDSDDRALAALGRLDGLPGSVTIVRYDDASVFDAIDSFLLRSRGEWIGFSSLDAVYGVNFFRVLRREMALQYELAAAVTELTYGSALKSRSLNARIKAPRKVRIPSSLIVPFIDLENVFVRKALLVDVSLGRDRSLIPPGSARGLSEVYAYFRSLGDATIKVFPNLHKRMAVRRGSIDPFGIGAPDSMQAAIDNLLTLARLCRGCGDLPVWMQVRLAFAVFNLFEYQTVCRSAFDWMEESVMQELDGTIRELLQLVSFDVVEDHGAGFARWAVRYGVYYRYMGICPLTPPVYFDDFDSVSGLVRMRMLFPCECDLSFIKNDHAYQAPIVRISEQRFAGSIFLVERIVWISVLALSELKVLVNGNPCPMYVKNKRVPTVTGALFDRYIASPEFSFHEAPKAFALRYLAAQGVGSARYRDCWLFIDKDDKADDNAEHFYRWVKNNAREGERSFFVLRRESRDWERLQQEGFQLLEFGSLQHKLALLNAAWLFSSHAAPFVVNLLPKKYFADMLRYKFCFLQHGVTKDDQSAWLNSRQIDMLVTVGQAEYESMSSGSYKYTSREVVLSGFPRYDALHARRREHPKRLVIMPTWRLHLSGELQGKTSQRAINHALADSEYCREWGGLLSNAALMDSLAAAGYEVVFLAHPNIQPYLSLFHLAPSVTLADLGSSSIQEYLVDCALLITDYSSIAFDVAYLRRPVLYFQFDLESFFASHTYGRGYFDYETHGFGPVVYHAPQLIDTIAAMQKKDFALEQAYRERIEQFFAFDDDGNSRRVYQEVLRRSGAYFRL